MSAMDLHVALYSPLANATNVREETCCASQFL